jgi:carboxypeptidase family protein
MRTLRSLLKIGRGGPVLTAELKRWLALAVLAGIPLLAFSGQSGTVLKGTLEDSTGAAVPGVEVKLRSLSDSKEVHETSDEDGYFEFGGLAPGKFVVDVVAPGFQELTQPVEIGATPPRPLRLRLQIAETKVQVTVSAQGPSLVPSALENTDHVTLDQTMLHDLPVKDADPLTVPSLFLEPAAVGARGPQLIVDGMESSSLELPLSSIREVSVNKSPYSAEFGRPGIGRIEVTTRKGSHHRYRGQVFQLVRNSALDARNAFALSVPELQRGVTEAQLEGPLTRHLAFFLAGQYYTNNQASTINAVTLQGPLVENFMAPDRKYYAFGRLDYDHHGHRLSIMYKYKDKSKQNQNVGDFNLPETATLFLDRENEFKVLETEATSGGWLNELRFSLKQQPSGTTSASNHPAIVVPGAFVSGGAQVSQQLRETSLLFEDVASWVRGKHTVQFGGAERPRLFSVRDASNFGGTFYFPSLSAFRAGNPLLFTMNQGNPEVSFTQMEYFSFIQDQIRLRQNLSLSLGLRHEGQSNVDDYHNFAPRLAMAYAPLGGRTVLRAGAGLFYDREPEFVEQEALLYNGARTRQIVIPDPTYPSPFGSSPPASFSTPSVMRIAPGITNPYEMQANLSVERQFGTGRNFLTVDFTTLRGLHLYRLRNINAPLAGSLEGPNPDFININQFESSGKLRSNSLTVTVQTTRARRFDLMAQYVLSKSMDDTVGILPSSTSSLLFFPVNLSRLFPANSYDLRGEWGRSDFDRRHRLNLLAFYRMPFGFKSGAVLKLNSGRPFNITTGFDNNHDNVLNDRPPGVGRNMGNGPGYADVDLHLSKEFKLTRITETTRMELGIDAFNIFNHVNYDNFVGTLTSPFFGRANAAQAARQLQLSCKFKF